MTYGTADSNTLLSLHWEQASALGWKLKYARFQPDRKRIDNGQLSLLEANSEITGSTLPGRISYDFSPFLATKCMLTGQSWNLGVR